MRRLKLIILGALSFIFPIMLAACYGTPVMPVDGDNTTDVTLPSSQTNPIED